MNSVILRVATRLLLPVILLFSVVVLLQGHNKPGGGFIGGLLAATALALHALAFGVVATRRLLRVDLTAVIGAGLLVAAASGLLGVFAGAAPFLTGVWGYVPLPGFGEVKVGTPLLFDAGVYLVVVGIATLMALSMLED